MASEKITRRHLPHWFVPEAFHFVTYRLAGTIPRPVLDDLKVRKEAALNQKAPAGLAPATFRERIHKQFFAEYDRYLDQSREIQWLAEPAVAALIRENLYHHRGTKYHLLSYCIMPNHVHVLLQPMVAKTAAPGEAQVGQAKSPVAVVGQATLPGASPGQTTLPVLPEAETDDAGSVLSSIMHSLKGYTASQANKILGRSGTFWQDESYDHWVRDEDELRRIVEYIAANPVKAGLVREPAQWFFCSAHDRFLQDGSREGWLLP
jgi:putative transposase